MKLDYNDLRWAVQLLPKKLRNIMQSPDWSGKIFVGGGYLRSTISNEKINDIDLFVNSKKDAELLAYKLSENKSELHKTENAYTIKDKIPIQIIHRWVFQHPEDVSNSFDFTVSCAVIYCNVESENKYNYDSFCDDRFYIDLAAKRLIYRSPVRNEDAGGSMLRVLKYYQKGYRIPLDSLGAVIARLIKSLDINKVDINNETQVAHVLTGLLREVDPNIDPTHNAHLPSVKDDIIQSHE